MESKIKPVCSFCKRRKIKCDRGVPCSSCVKFSNANCEYIAPGPRAARRKPIRHVRPDLESELQALKAKISTLETILPESNYSSVNTLFIDNGAAKINVLDRDESRDTFKNQVRVGGFGTPSLLSSSKTLVVQLDNLHKVHFDDDFNELMSLIDPKDEKFSLFTTNKFLMDHEPIGRRNFGILAWKGTLNSDICLSKIFEYTRKHLKKHHMFAVKNQKDRFHLNALKRHLGSNVEPINEVDTFDETGPACDSKDVNLGDSKLSYNFGLHLRSSTRDDQLSLIARIEKLLPTREIIWKHINIFFDKFYCYVPIIDEIDFKDHMTRILKLNSDTSLFDTNAITLNVRNKLDFAYLGVLLIMLRLGYLSLIPTINNDEEYYKKTSDSNKVLLDNPIGLDVVEASNDCLNQFSLFASTSLSIYQLTMMTRFYRIYSPENGDGPDHGDSQVFISTLFQMAYSLGLNRDPDMLDRDEKTKNLCRKMWYSLLVFDLNHSLEFGDPLNVNKFTFDTRIPTYIEGNSNLIDAQREQEILNGYQILNVVYEPLTHFLNELLDVNGQMKLTDLCRKIHYLKYKMFALDGAFKPPPSPLNAATTMLLDTKANIYKTKIEAQFGYFMSSLFYVLFSHFESKQQYDLAFYYLTRFLEKVLLFIFPVYLELVNLENLDPAIDFLILPSIESILHKGLSSLISILAKLNVCIYNFESNPQHSVYLLDAEYSTRFFNLKRLYNHVGEAILSFISIANAFSKKYYYSWIVARIHSHFLSFITSGNFIETIVKTEPMEFPLFTDNFKLQELLKILEGFFKKRDELKTRSAKSRYGIGEESMGEFEKWLHRLNTDMESYDQSTNSTSDTPTAVLDANIPNTYLATTPTPESDIYSNPSKTTKDMLANPDNVKLEDVFDSNEIDSAWLNLISQKSQPNGFDDTDKRSIDFNFPDVATPSFDLQLESNPFVTSFIMDELFKDLSK